MTTEAMRAQFEAAMRRDGCLFTREGDDYMEMTMRFAWLGYQAALRSPATAGLVEALDAIWQYGSDTLSGRVDSGPDDRKWQRDAVLEMTRRARIARDNFTGDKS